MRFLVRIFFPLVFSLASQDSSGFCKWVDKEGVTHYAETCPEDVDSTEVVLPDPPTQEQTRETSRIFEQSLEKNRARKKEIEVLEGEREKKAEHVNQVSEALKQQGYVEVVFPEQVDCKSLLARKSIQELEAQCEAAREERLAPERAAEIKKCKAQEENDPKWCEMYWETYGDARASGPRAPMEPRGYDWLPECVAARKCKHEAR